MTIAEADNGRYGSLGEHRTVTRVMSIIELVMASEPTGARLGDLSGAIDAPKSTVHGLAKGLVATGYLREEDGHYLIGPAISGLLAAGASRLPSAYHHTLEQLSERWGETSILGTLVGEAVVYPDVVEPVAVIRASPPMNKRLSLWPRSSGKVFLAHMERRRMDAFLRRQFPDPVDQERVRAELAAIRETGIAISTAGPSNDELLGIASPVTFARSPVNTAIAVAGPAARMRDKLDQIADDIRDAARALSVRAR
jgi:DNA-binding IclR family transcriptional regulator